MDPIKLANFFATANSVLFVSENDRTVINPDLVFDLTDLGGRHRVRIMDALRSAAAGQDIQTPAAQRAAAPWYASPNEFVAAAAEQLNMNDPELRAGTEQNLRLVLA